MATRNIRILGDADPGSEMIVTVGGVEVFSGPVTVANDGALSFTQYIADFAIDNDNTIDVSTTFEISCTAGRIQVGPMQPTGIVYYLGTDAQGQVIREVHLELYGTPNGADSRSNVQIDGVVPDSTGIDTSPDGFQPFDNWWFTLQSGSAMTGDLLVHAEPLA